MNNLTHRHGFICSWDRKDRETSFYDSPPVAGILLQLMAINQVLKTPELLVCERETPVLPYDRCCGDMQNTAWA